MGMSKALMEKIAIAKGRSLGKNAATIICATRYGNVMCSRGSVIPLWMDQIKENKEITITDPEMTRYMMTLDNAIDLVLYAFSHGNSGDLFVQKAPAATLQILCDAIRELFKSNSSVKVIGTRHGEKLYETLVTREEMVRAVDKGQYFCIPCDERNLNYDNYFENGDHKISRSQDYNSSNAKQLDVKGMQELLLQVDMVREAVNKQK
jgi:UDP-glucose 4-epimerase